MPNSARIDHPAKYAAIAGAAALMIVTDAGFRSTEAHHSLAMAKAEATPVCQALAKGKSKFAYHCNNPDSKIIKQLSGHLSKFGCRSYVVGGTSVWVRKR